MAEKKPHQYYRIKEGKLERILQACPKCGTATWLAVHENRLACGKCGYTEWKK
ncbi:MAG: 30S ribosomal protein S27ae [Candidatus Thermoplasmatota archaeon]